MGSFTCPFCGNINSVTSIPNDIDGYFILDKDINEFRYCLDEGYIPDKAIPACRCEKCKRIDAIDTYKNQ